MVQISGKELLAVKRILDDLNAAYPVRLPGIPTKKWVEGELKSTYAKQDPHFLAYKSDLGIWWLVCQDYSRWTESYNFLKQYCKYIQQQFKCQAHPCHEHPVSMGRYKTLHKQKKVFMVGDVSWA